MKHFLIFCIFIYSYPCFGQLPTSVSATRSIDIGYHPFLESIQLCTAVDFDDLNHFKPSAFKFSFDSSVVFNPSIKVKAYLVRGEEEVNKLLNYDSKVEASIPLVASGSATVQANIKTSSRQDNLRLVFIAEQLFNPEIPNDNKIELTDIAKSKLGNADQFVENFGTYFVSKVFRGHRLKVEVSLSKSFSSSFISLFAEGTASLDLEVVGIEAKTSIRGELKKVTTNNEASVSIETYGGPQLNNFSTLIPAIFQSDTSYGGIISFLTGLISKFEYANSKPLKCVLSDYSAWGIKRNTLIQEDILSTQLELKKLHFLISRELLATRFILNNQTFKINYTPDQLNKALVNSKKYITLRKVLEDAHTKLNHGDESMTGVDLQIGKDFSDIKQDNPEVFEYLASRQQGPPISYIHDRFNVIANITNLKSILNNSFVFNTINTLGGFNFIDRIVIVNDLTNQTVETINLSALSAANLMNLDVLKFLTIGRLVESSRLDVFCGNIDKNMLNTFGSLIGNRPLANVEAFQYSMLLVDKAQRRYFFPFLDVNLSQISTTSQFFANISHALPENCCSNLEDFDVVNSGTGGSISILAPETIFLNLKNIDLDFSDSLIVELRTDNPIVNRELIRMGDFDLRFGVKDFADVLAQPSIGINFGNLLFSINNLKVTYYSKKKTNQIDSDKRTVTFPYSRKICNRTFFLK